MTADQRKKLLELQEIINHLEIYETGKSEDIDQARLLIYELLVEPNPFQSHWETPND